MDSGSPQSLHVGSTCMNFVTFRLRASMGKEWRIRRESWTEEGNSADNGAVINTCSNSYDPAQKEDQLSAGISGTRTARARVHRRERRERWPARQVIDSPGRGQELYRRSSFALFRRILAPTWPPKDAPRACTPRTFPSRWQIERAVVTESVSRRELRFLIRLPACSSLPPVCNRLFCTPVVGLTLARASRSTLGFFAWAAPNDRRVR